MVPMDEPFFPPRQVLKTRVLRIDWERGPLDGWRSQPVFRFTVYTDRRYSRVQLDVGRLCVRWSPIAKDQWKKDGRRFWRPLSGASQ